MLAKEEGVLSGSDLYFMTPSENAKEMLFYPTACGYYYTDNAYLRRRDTYYYSYLILYLIKGQMSVTSEKKRELVRPGQVCFLDCRRPHSYGSMKHAEFIWIHADGSNITAFHEKAIQIHGSYVFTPGRGEAVRAGLYRFTYQQRNQQIITEWQLSDQLYQLLTLLMEKKSDTQVISDRAPAASPVIRHAMEYIQEHFSEPLRLEQIAKEAGMSKFYFSRLFKQACGFSPHEYLIITRMNRAMFLLKTTDLPVREIALQVGYQNETTFTTAFGSRIGLPPARFRKFPI